MQISQNLLHGDELIVKLASLAIAASNAGQPAIARLVALTAVHLQLHGCGGQALAAAMFQGSKQPLLLHHTTSVLQTASPNPAASVRNPGQQVTPGCFMSRCLSAGPTLAAAALRS